MQARTCTSCGSVWDAPTARWCGACGAALPRGRGRSPAALPLGTATMAGMAAIVAAGLLGVLVVGGDRSAAETDATGAAVAGGQDAVALPTGDREQIATVGAAGVLRCPARDDCIAWSFALPVTGRELPEVVVADDRVVSSAAGLLSAHGLADGRALWSVDTWVDGSPLRPDGSPVVVGDLVLVRDELGALRTLALPTGEPVWEVAVGTVAQLDGAHRYGDVVAIVVTTRQPDQSQVVVGVERGTGVARWRRFGDRVLLGDDGPVLLRDGEVVGIDPVSGTDAWRRWLRGATAEATAVGSVLVTTTASRDGVPWFAEVLAGQDGRLLRAIRVQPGSVPPVPRVAGPLVLGDSAQVSLVEADGSGWTAATPEGRCCDAQAVGPGEVVVQLTRDRLLTLDRQDGRRLAVEPIQHAAAWADLGTVHGLLRFRVSDDGRWLEGYSLAEGRPLVELPRTALRTVATVDGRLLLVQPGEVTLLRSVTSAGVEQ